MDVGYRSLVKCNYVVLFMVIIMISIVLNAKQTGGAISLQKKTRNLIDKANQDGPYLGLVIPNLFEMNPLINSPDYKPTNVVIDISGRRFRFGTIGDKRVILVMTGLGMINAGITTQLLLSFFDVEGVVHYGIAGNANPSLNIGDVTVPQYWSHTALWYWQRYGQGPEDELALESNGDYTREIGYLNFASETVNVTGCSNYGNLLNNIWYQPEEIFPIDGTPEQRDHIFWVHVDSHYYSVAKTLQDLELEGCLNSTTCLSTTPKVYTVDKGTSASIYLDNAAYRAFIFTKFNVSPVDMESASVALICFQQRVPFIAIRALSDLAGGGSADSNEADVFINLAANNSITAVLAFVNRLSAHPVYLNTI